MDGAVKILKYELQDVVRSKWLFVYAAFFFLITYGLFSFGGNSTQVLLSLMNIVLVLIPLVGIVFGTMYVYHSREFVELLLSQPVRRKSIYRGVFSGLAVPLALSFTVGTTLPFLFFGTEQAADWITLAALLSAGTVLTFVFVALAFVVSLKNEDRLKGFGISILLWFFFAILYDGLVLFSAYAFGDYPLEKAMIVLSVLNPIDLARIIMLLNFDISALMGYTGAIFKQFFGSGIGIGIGIASLAVWFALPFFLGQRAFDKKDF